MDRKLSGVRGEAEVRSFDLRVRLRGERVEEEKKYGRIENESMECRREGVGGN